MAGSRLEFFLKSVGYPDRAPDGCVSFTLRVDGVEVLAEEAEGRLVLSCALTDDESILPVLATYAAGRMLKEGAALTYGRRPTVDERSSAFLWQEAPSDFEGAELTRFFENFMDSCDWWRARVETLREEASAGAVPETMVIRP